MVRINILTRQESVDVIQMDPLLQAWDLKVVEETHNVQEICIQINQGLLILVRHNVSVLVDFLTGMILQNNVYQFVLVEILFQCQCKYAFWLTNSMSGWWRRI